MDAVSRLLEHDRQFRDVVREGIAAADPGDLIDDEEVPQWLEERERS